jgi:acylphosphatase
MTADADADADAGRVGRRVLVGGRVQGVFFRDSCRQRAIAAGVSGWVRNRHDGRVEAVFEGSPDAVEQLVAWCRRGPRRAEVRGVEVTEAPQTGLTGFAVH